LLRALGGVSQRSVPFIRQRYRLTNVSQQAWPWWRDPAGLVGQFPRVEGGSETCDWYRIVDAFLGIESDDASFRARFRELYSAFRWRSPHATSNAGWLQCRVQVANGLSANLVTFTGSEEFEIVDFIAGVYRERGYVEMHPSANWRSIGVSGSPTPLLTAQGAHVLVDACHPWQPLIATCAINWVMGMQRDLLFLHAAAVGIDGSGILISGEKGTGKSTSSIALAATGHSFFGDEIVAVKPSAMEVFPFRRAVSIRPGPQSTRVERLLSTAACSTETFPDGTTRRRGDPNVLFPKSSERSLPLRFAFFLRAFEESPRAEEFVPRPDDLKLLAPMPGTFWGVSPAVPIMQLAQLLANLKCYLLNPGLPDETASLIETIVRTG
jgi:hypothetical protein